MRFTLRTKKWILIFAILLGFLSNIFAQETCSQKLKKAQEFFKNGQNEKVASLLEECLANKNFDKNEMIVAYRLLTLSRLYAADDSASVEAMRGLLKKNPEYEIDMVEDPAEFINLYETFKTSPVAIIGVKLGGGPLNIHSINYFNDINSTDDTISYNPNYTLTAGIHCELPLFSFVSMDLGASYNMFVYSYSRNILDYSVVDYTESVSMIGVPVLLQFNLLKKTKLLTYTVEGVQKQREIKRKFMPYINIGATAGINIYSNVTHIIKTDTQEDKETRKLESSAGINVSDSRNLFNYALTGGVGCRIKDVIGRGMLTLDVRYSHYFLNLVDRENRYASDELVYNYLHTDNEFKFEDISFLIGYSIPLYSAKQYKKYIK